MKLADDRAILGIDPSQRGLAFVFFERGELIDWGTRHDRDHRATAAKLLHEYSPEALVLEDANDHRCRRDPRLRSVLRSIASDAESKSVAVLPVSRDEMRREWTEHGVTTKEAIAAEVARHFPHLDIIVPPHRKIFRSEDHRIRIFDAAAFVFWACGTAQREADGIPMPHLR